MTASDITSQMVARNVRRIRVDRGLTLDDVAGQLTAERHPIIKSQLSRLETGRRNVSASDLVMLARVLNVTVTELLRGDVCPTCRRPRD